jgi:hypothetical protein
MIIAKELSPKESKTESYQMPQSLATSEHSLVKGTPQHIRDWLMSSAAASPANHFPLQESEQEQTTHEICGPQLSQPYARLDHATASLRTFQASLLVDTSSESFATLPKAGIACDGVVYQQPRWEQVIGETDSGLWPTPRTRDWKGSGKDCLDKAIESLPAWIPCPCCDEYLCTIHQMHAHDCPCPPIEEWDTDPYEDSGGGKLNPTWVEWLMGWIPGWTDLKPLEMDKFRQWQQQHGDY